MNLPLAFLTATLAVAEASGDGFAPRWANLRRRLSFKQIAGYSPVSQVTDHCAIDLDQAAIESLLTLKTTESFQHAQQIYNNGGNSKSYAEITLATPLLSRIRKGDYIRGKNDEGTEVGGKAYTDYEPDESVIKVQYITTDIQESYVECQVGALLEPNKKGCFTETGCMTIEGRDYDYTYDPATDNKNGRTIAGFSEGDNAKKKMRVGCTGCPYTEFQYFYDYYGTDEYAHQFVEAAFEGKLTQFQNGNADFSQYDLIGKEQIIKKATAYMNIFMYVIYEFSDALDDCELGCINCNSDPVSAWDEGVCFYTGSLEGADGTLNGNLLHNLADRRCENFKTCGVEGIQLDGMSKLNYDILTLFAAGQFQLQTGNCPAARLTLEKIMPKMYVPMIQGALYYAYKVDKLMGGEKEKAEGAVFAAAVLPRIHAASPGAATKIYNNMKVGASSTDFNAVKTAFEEAYKHIGISCSEIGGLWSSKDDQYLAGTDPCIESDPANNMDVEKKEINFLVIGLNCAFGSLFALAVATAIYMCKREKDGNPVFKTEWTIDRWREQLSLNLSGK